MPTYEYSREDGTVFDYFQGINDAALEVCPTTGQKVKRIISGGTGVIYKGEGWYVTDYKNKNKNENKNKNKNRNGNGSDSGNQNGTGKNNSTDTGAETGKSMSSDAEPSATRAPEKTPGSATGS
ncbi:MAG: FmdB family zinc ribbon protein [Cyclonatronaceae bacterium]